MGCYGSVRRIVPLSGTANIAKGTSLCGDPLDWVRSDHPLVPDHHFECYCCNPRELVRFARRASKWFRLWAIRDVILRRRSVGCVGPFDASSLKAIRYVEKTQRALLVVIKGRRPLVRWLTSGYCSCKRDGVY